MQDEMIVDLYWKRDESAISETERKYGRYLSKIAYNILSDWEDSKETVNDTYLKAWNSMPTHKPSVLSTYLGKITRQLSIDAFRTRNRDKRKHSEYAVSLSELEDCISSSETTEQSIELKLLAEAINTYANSSRVQLQYSCAMESPFLSIEDIMYLRISWRRLSNCLPS